MKNVYIVNITTKINTNIITTRCYGLEAVMRYVCAIELTENIIKVEIIKEV